VQYKVYAIQSQRSGWCASKKFDIDPPNGRKNNITNHK
jgi:hypothetical protein